MGNAQSQTVPDHESVFHPKPREMSITDRFNEFLAFLARNKQGIRSGLAMADFLCASLGKSNPHVKTLSSLIKCLSGLLLKLDVEKTEGKSSENQTNDRNLMRTVRAEIMLDLDKLKEDLPLFQAEYDEMHEMLSQLYFMPGWKRIQGQYVAMLKASPSNLEQWAKEFFYNKNSFGEILGDFNKENIKAFLESVYRNKCQKSIEPLVKCLNYVIYMRVLYLHILVCFYDNLPMGSSTPQMTSAQLAIKEVEHYCENIKTIYDIAVNVCPFLPAAEKFLAPDIEYIPNILENSINYLGEYTIGQLEGKQDVTESKKFKVYGKSLIHSEPSFIKIVDTTHEISMTCLLGNKLTEEGPVLYQSQKEVDIYRSSLVSIAKEDTRWGYLLVKSNNPNRLYYARCYASNQVHPSYFEVYGNVQSYDQKTKKWNTYHNSSLFRRYLAIRDVIIPNDSVKSHYCESNNQNETASTSKDEEKPKDVVSQNLNITTKLVGQIMGSGGDIINNIQKESGASIKVQKRGDDHYRSIMIKGEKDEVECAINLIADKVGNKKIRTQIIIWIPTEKVGKLIGKEGKTIKAICEESEAFIKINERRPQEDGNDKCIIITGNPLAVKTARQMIEDRIGYGCVEDQKLKPPPAHPEFGKEWITFYKEFGMTKESALLTNQLELAEAYRKELDLKDESFNIEKEITKAMKSFNILSIKMK